MTTGGGAPLDKATVLGYRDRGGGRAGTLAFPHDAPHAGQVGRPPQRPPPPPGLDAGAGFDVVGGHVLCVSGWGDAPPRPSPFLLCLPLKAAFLTRHHGQLLHLPLLFLLHLNSGNLQKRGMGNLDVAKPLAKHSLVRPKQKRRERRLKGTYHVAQMCMVEWY